MISYDAILAVMERRFDHVSARVVLGEALKAAGLATNQKQYSPEEVRSLAGAVAAVGSRVEAVTAALNDLASAGPTVPVATPEVPEVTPEVTEEPVPSPEASPAETPVEEPVEAEAAPKKKKKK